MQEDKILKEVEAHLNAPVKDHFFHERLEYLLNQEYIERDGKDPSLIHYIP